MKYVIAFVVAGQLFSSCFGPKPIKESHSGELTESDSKLSDRDPDNDDSFYDEYEFEADKGMVISVALNSDAFDAYLHLLGTDGVRIEDHDDIDEQQNTNARIRCLAPDRGKYTVIANSYDVGETGAYQLELETSKAGDGDSGLATCGGSAASAQPPRSAPSSDDAPSEVEVVE